MYYDHVMELIITTLDVIGTVLIGWAALRVHHRVLNEHKIDEKVMRVMRVEQKLGILGIVLVLLAYLLHIMQ